MAKHIVAVYLQDRRLGGPEEGGWWYDTGALVRVMAAFGNDDAALDYCQRLNDKLASRQFGPNVGRREISSVISTGVYGAEIYEDAPPASYPTQRPHYE